MIVLQVRGVGSVTDGPLGPLLNGKEAKGTVAFPRRCLSFPKFGANSARWLASSVTDEQDLFQTRDSFLGSANDDGIAHRGAVTQNCLLHGF